MPFEYDPIADRLLMAATGSLLSVNVKTGAPTRIGFTGISLNSGLALDNTYTLYVSSVYPSCPIYTIDMNSAHTTFLTFTIEDSVRGLAYDSERDMLVGITQNSNNAYSKLVSIDRTTGSTVNLASLPLIFATGLAYDSDKDLYWVLAWLGPDAHSGLFCLDPENLVAGPEIVYHFGSVCSGLGYRSIPPVPEPTTVAIWGGLGAIGLIARRRKRDG